MAETDVYFQGKAKWARLVTPDPEYHKWSVTLYFNPKSLEEFKALKLRNIIKQDEDGFYSRLSREQSKQMGSVLVAFVPPQVFDKEGLPMDGVLIGNGSDVTVKCKLRKYKDKRSGEMKNAIRMESVRVDSLVPYEKKDFPPDVAKAAEGLIDQPAQLF